MTIEENLKMHCVFYQAPEKEVEESIHFVLNLVDLLPERSKMVGSLILRKPRLQSRNCKRIDSLPKSVVLR